MIKGEQAVVFPTIVRIDRLDSVEDILIFISFLIEKKGEEKVVLIDWLDVV